ncbi:hypothetical protein GGS20DRAFT_531690, partial [Poronia punctata]
MTNLKIPTRTCACVNCGCFVCFIILLPPVVRNIPKQRLTNLGLATHAIAYLVLLSGFITSFFPQRCWPVQIRYAKTLWLVGSFCRLGGNNTRLMRQNLDSQLDLKVHGESKNPLVHRWYFGGWNDGILQSVANFSRACAVDKTRLVKQMDLTREATTAASTYKYLTAFASAIPLLLGRCVFALCRYLIDLCIFCLVKSLFWF